MSSLASGRRSKLRFGEEARRYLARELHQRSEDDLSFIFATAAALESVPNSVNWWLVIPCHYLEQLRAQYVSQLHRALLGNPKLAIVVFVNGAQEECDEQTFAKNVERLSLQCQRSERLKVMSRRFNEVPAIGRIKGLVTDAIIVKCTEDRVCDPILIYNDADTLFIAEQYFARMASACVDTTKLLAGPVLYRYPGRRISRRALIDLFVFDAAQLALNRLARNGLINFECRIWPEGANMGASAAAYCAVGGFDFNCFAGEDDQLGKRLHRYNPNAVAGSVLDEDFVFIPDRYLTSVFCEDAWVATDPRRVLATIEQGYPGIETWSRVPFAEHRGTGLAGITRQRSNRGRLSNASIPRRGKGGQGADLHQVVSGLFDHVENDIRVRNADQMQEFFREVGLIERQHQIDEVTFQAIMEVPFLGASRFMTSVQRYLDSEWKRSGCRPGFAIPKI